MNGRFVIDNSIVMTWCFKDEADQYADAVLSKLTQTDALVPAIWPLEVVNVLLVAERRKRLREVDTVHFLSLLSQLPIRVEKGWPEMSMNELLSLGRATDLSSYDASYLDLAMRHGLPLASLDQKLVIAAIDTFTKNQLGLTVGHAYTVLDYDPEADKVTIKDPNRQVERKDTYNSSKDGIRDGIFTLTMDEFHKYFSHIAYEK